MHLVLLALLAATSTSWQYQAQEDKMTDETIHILLKRAEGTITEHTGREFQPALAVRCDNGDGALTVWMMPEIYMAGPEVQQIMIRLDEQEPEPLRVMKAKNSKMASAFGAKKFLARLQEHERLLVRFEHHGGADKTYEVNLEGMREAMKPLRQGCKW